MHFSFIKYFTQGMLLLLTALFVLKTKDIYAQQPSFEWAGKMGGDAHDLSSAIAVDRYGNVLTTGWFSDTADFDPGPTTYNLTANSGYGIQVSKLDAAGKFVWAKQFQGTDDGVGQAIATDTSGNVYIAGWFNGTGDFDPGPDTFYLTSASYSFFIVKLSAAGTFIWAKHIGGLPGEEVRPQSISLDADGNVYTTGYFFGTIDFDPGTGNFNLATGSNMADIFILKLDDSGNFVWAKSVGGALDDIGNSITTDNNNNIYITGSFRGLVDFDPAATTFNLTSNGGADDIFILKLTANGNFIWAKSIGEFYDDIGYSIIAAPTGGIYVTGSYRGSVDFNPGADSFKLTASGSSDAFIVKLDTGGNFVWAKSMGGISADVGYTIDADTYGDIYTAGHFSGTVDFNPGASTFNLTSTGDWDLFITKLNTNGDFIWAKNMGGISTEYINKILAVDIFRNIYTTGSFEGTVDFDPGPGVSNLTSTYLDIFVHKMSQLPEAGCTGQPTYNTLTTASCNSYSFLGKTYTASGTYNDTIPNAANCDSIITLHLTINQNTYDTLVQKACNSYTIKNKTYTSGGIYAIDTLTGKNGCDSFVFLNLTVNYSTHDTIKPTVCDNFTLNGHTYTATGTYTDTLQSINGCDSIITINLTVNNNSGTLVHTGCKTFTLENKTYTESGAYTQVLTNEAGCDSVLTIDLTIIHIDTAVDQNERTLTAEESDAAYQWIDCNNSNSPITGATQQSFTPNIDGSYAVIVTQYGCSDTSDCFAIEQTGIKEWGADNQVELYPNPTNGLLNIKTENALRNALIRLVNITGQTLLENPNQYGTIFVLDIRSLASGIYFVEIIENRITERVKIVKE